MASDVTLWRFGRQDLAPALWIALLPLAVYLPLLAGWLQADPVVYLADMALDLQRGPLKGRPYIDPNNGYTTQALGYRAALDWLQGSVPWWNPYSGVGLPLAAEYQPAAFFPLTFLLLLPRGTVLLQLALVLVAGFGTYGLLRQMGLARLASTCGALLFAFNGTLAWFAHAPATAVPFLPWMLWGIERAHASAAAGLAGGWRMLAAAMGLGLLAGFPETAYINGLLALAWSVLRGVQAPAARRMAYAVRIAAGGMVGILVAAPQMAAFFLFLPEAFLGGHAGDFALSALPPHAIVPTLVAPYVYGPIFGYMQWEMMRHVWGSMGGYVTILLVACALYGLCVRRDALAWLLFAWCVLVLGKTFRVEPAVTLLNLVPGVTAAAFARYAHPAWAFAMIVLAAGGLDHLARHGVQRKPLAIAGLGAAAILLLAGAYQLSIWPHALQVKGMRNSALASAFWAVLTLAAAAWTAARSPPARRAAAFAALLSIDAALMFAIPTLGNPRHGSPDIAAVDFLRANLGLQRFFTLGPIEPNYGAYFGIASINHNYLPVSERWVTWIKRHLHPGLPDGAIFNGRAPGAAQHLASNLAAYRRVGVKYVVTPRDEQPFAGEAAAGLGAKRVYRSEALSIFELAGAAPYFEATGGPCTVQAAERTRASLECAAPATLVRRELFSTGWSASVNGQAAAIAEHDALFQAVPVPAGRSEVRFGYAPPHIGWAWIAALAALALLLLPAFRAASIAVRTKDRP